MRYAHIQSQAMPGTGGGPEGRPASPCISVCQLDADDVCRGCGRTLAEIAAWPAMSASEQRAVIDRLRRRGRGA